MTIAVRCQCGQRFSVKDELAGKKGKCPQCGLIFRIPMESSDVAPPPVGPSSDPASNQPDLFGRLGSLFDEEGIGVAGQTPVRPGEGKLCPECRKVVPADSLLCVECGWNFEAHKKLETKRGRRKRQTMDPLNPYAIDTYFDDGEEELYSGGKRTIREEPGNRKGPAWELDDAYLANYFQTVMEILVTPGFAFGKMGLHGGYAAPLSFVLVGYVFSYIIASFVSFAIISLFGVMPCTGEPFPAHLVPLLGLSMLCGMFIGISCSLVVLGLILPIVLFLSSSILHLSLMIVGGAKRDLEATFRASSYVFGALILPEMLLALIPFLGQILAYALQWVYTLIAIKHTHEIEWWKALVAAFIWAVVILGIIIGFVILIAAILYTQLGLENGFPFPER